MRIELVYRTIPRWLLREYLVKVGGQVELDGRVRGEGWNATLTELEPGTMFHARVDVVRIEFEGDEETLKRVVREFERYATRAGG